MEFYQDLRQLHCMHSICRTYNKGVNKCNVKHTHRIKTLALFSMPQLMIFQTLITILTLYFLDHFIRFLSMAISGEALVPIQFFRKGTVHALWGIAMICRMTLYIHPTWVHFGLWVYNMTLSVGVK